MEGDEEAAFNLYAYNMKISEALYTPLQMLEVTLRNRFHATLASAYGDHWYDESALQLSEKQRDQLKKAKRDIELERKEVQPGQVIANLNLGFWTGFLSPHADTLWQQILNRAVSHKDGKGLSRKELSVPMTKIRVLRNRIAHHEAIWHWNLPLHHENILKITGWLYPAAEQWSRHFGQFNMVWSTSFHK